MKVFAITKGGLIAIALAVASLWACIGMEAVTRRRAEREARVSLQTLWKLKQNSAPTAAPVHPSRLPRPIAS